MNTDEEKILGAGVLVCILGAVVFYGVMIWAIVKFTIHFTQ